jgi:hypothetical protein
VGDTLITDSMPPEIDELRRQPAPTPAAGVPPPLGVTVTQAASPVAMAVFSGPRPVPPRSATPPPMPAVVVPTPPPLVPAHEGDDTRTAVAEAHLMGPQPLLRASLSNEYAPPPAHPAPTAMPHGPPDMQRLFAPPTRDDNRTVTAQSLRRRIPVWAVAVGSAVLGLVAFGIVVAAISHRSHDSTATAPSASASAIASGPAPIVIVAPAPGPFTSARTAFEAVLAPAASPSPINAPPPPPAPAQAGGTPGDSSAKAPPPLVIPTTNVASLPAAAPRKGSSRGAPPPAPPPEQSTTPSETGTLKVICFPGCDQVVDNNAPLGPSPIVRRNAPVGSHRIKLIWSDANKVVSTVVIADSVATVRENHP